MGILVPDDFSLASLRNDAERKVVQALHEQLTDAWVVLPNVTLSDRDRDREIDVVVAHPKDGVAVIEVKGHRPEIRQGVWYAGGEPMEPQPLAQASDNAYALRRRLRDAHPSLRQVRVEHAVALPNVTHVRGSLPAEVDRSQVLTEVELQDCREAIARLVLRRSSSPPGEVGVHHLVQLLRPSCQLTFHHETRARLARAKLDVICEQQTRALEPLDLNRRVCVTGAAGTGKTRLAMAWANRARLRDERVLLTCFNVPLATVLHSRFGHDPDLRIGAFHEVALELAGMPPLEVPDRPDRAWWDTVHLPHLHAHWDEVTERFDTIVVDEAQDFDPAWIGLLERLLDPDGPRRLMLVADVSQTVFPRGFRVPGPDDGWTRCELTANCRNTFQIADLVRHRFGGAAAPVGGPETEDLRFLAAADLDSIVEAVGDAFDALEDRDHPAPSVLVATLRSAVRDRLRDELGFVSWEERDPMAVVCENVHRIKGLEFDHVILVAFDPDSTDVSDELLYVGASRAVMSLTVVGPPAVGERLGLVPHPPSGRD